MKAIEIKLRDGSIRTVRISHFPAHDGWEIENQLIRFAASDDAKYRKAYTMRILSYATVLIGENEIPFTTDDVVDNHLQSWENVKLLFEEVLRYNGIEPRTHVIEFQNWDMVGAKIGEAMMTYVSKVYEMATETAKTQG